jgi:trehalose/maltose hydrolase-like predicted phosphorylase
VGVDTALTTADHRASAVAAAQTAAGKGWSTLYNDHAGAWGDLWRSDIAVSGQPELQGWIRSNLYP